MARFIIVGFLLLPIVEIALFIKVGQTIGLFPTLALVIAAGFAGAMLLRMQGVAILRQMQSSVTAGKMPAKTIAEAMMVGAAAVFLILPGFFSDIVAIALLLPPVRSWIYNGLSSRVVVRTAGAGYSQTYAEPEAPRVSRPGTIDLDEDDYRPR